MEKMREIEQKEQLKDFSNIEVKEILLEGTPRAVIMPTIHADINIWRESIREPYKNTLSLFKSEWGLSNLSPMGPDTVRPEIAEHFRMMELDEIVGILDSKDREVAKARSQLLMGYLLDSHLGLPDAPHNPHSGGWGGIMTNHAIRMTNHVLELAGCDELGLKRKYRGDDSLDGLYSAYEQKANIKAYDLNRLYSKYSPPEVTLKQIDKCCPDFIEELFKKEFEELPPFLQDAFFDLPSEEDSPDSWQPLSLALHLQLKTPTNSRSLKLSHGAIEVASACIGSMNRDYAGRAWWISK